MVAGPTQAWIQGLPRRVVAAGALIRDARGRVLLVEPTYKPTWEVPGGIVEAGESAATACARELHEELGLHLPVGRLLVVDWAVPVPGRGDAVRLIYDGGQLPEGSVWRLPAAELVSARFVDLDEIHGLCGPALAARVRAAVAAADGGQVVELDDGRPRGPGW